MDRGLDPRMQRILNDAAKFTSQNDQARSFDYATRPVERPQAGFSFAPASRPATQEPATFSPFTDGAPHQQPYQQPYHQLSHPSAPSNRLSLVRRYISSQPESGPRVLSSADNHFRFTQNLREGVPLNQLAPPIPMQNNTQSTDTIGQMANYMLTQGSATVSRTLQSIPQPRGLEPEAANLFGSLANSKLGQLQPQKQQITPPFNLNGFLYSPETRQSALSTSPLMDQGSSPTARVSLRRAATRAAPPITHTGNLALARNEDDVFSGGNKALSETPVRRTPRSTEYDYPRPPTIPSTHTPQKGLTSLIRNASSIALTHAPPIAHGIQLISPQELPDRFRHVFPYEAFNAAQSKCFHPIYKSNENIVVAAPTGSGKTAILELAICKVVEGCHQGTFKIVYLAPIKSLCSERLRDWTKKFSHLNLPCAELTGDTNLSEMSKVRAASIIVTTPEKWDSITRKWKDHAKLVQMVKLFLIDEVHILKDPRGATLEAIVSRMKKMSADVRFVALSATIPNSQDVATWLGKDNVNQHLPAHTEIFGEDFRPVKLQRHVHGFDGMMNDFAFERVLDGKLPGLIQRYNKKKPILVFCYTRKSCEQTAMVLAEWWSKQRKQDRAWSEPKEKVNVSNRDLRDLLDCGIAYHHAGLDVQDRHAVETGFLGGHVSVICCTSTLAVGVNLPCHLVVLKGTLGYTDGKLGEYSDLEVMQMLGRAGRPQFDDSAVAVIMTRSGKVERYNKMISGQDTLESTLHLNFIELLNSEISLGTVKNVYDAKVWLNGTFLAVRMRQNPKYYSIASVGAEGTTDQRLEQACERDINLLQKYNMVTGNDQFGCTEYGEAMSRYMVKFETMKLLLSIPPKAKTEQILETVCHAAEFRDLKMKPNERPVLREFNKSPFIKFPIKEAVTTTAHKVSLMIQVQLGGIELPNDKEFNFIKRQFMVDKSVIFDRVQRLMRCIIDCKSFEEDSIATRHALDLLRSISAGFWEYSNLQLRQIPQIGPAAVRKLVSGNVNSIEKLDEKDAAGIERIMSKNPPFGKKTKDHLAAFPRLELKSEIVGKVPFKQGKKPKVVVRAILGYKGTETPTWNGVKSSLTFVAETSEGRLVYFWRGNIAKLDKGYELRFNVELSSVDEQIKSWISCDDLVGTVKTSTLKHDIPASYFPPLSTHEESKPRELSEASKKKASVCDDFGDEELSDDEMIAMAKSLEAGDTDSESDGFADIDHLEALIQPKRARDVTKEKTEGERMSNGKFACQHTCRDGQLLKNGKQCKHKCCNEGLDKPPVRKRKSSAVDIEPGDASDKKLLNSHGTASVQSKKQKISSRAPPTKFKSERQSDMELEDVELVDIPDEAPVVPYEKPDTREYHKQLTPQTRIQKDKRKQKPQFSYMSSKQPEAPFLKAEKTTIKDHFGFDELSGDEFPTTTQLAGFSRDASCLEDYDNPSSTQKPKLPASTLDDDSLEDLEGRMVEFDDPVVAPAQTPSSRRSFAEGLFDFDAFDDVADGFGEQSSGLETAISSMVEQTREPESFRQAEGEQKVTRATSLEADIDEVKCRRITEAEQVQESAAAGNLPEWVNEFDAELIDSLKDYVDFIDE